MQRTTVVMYLVLAISLGLSTAVAQQDEESAKAPDDIEERAVQRMRLPSRLPSNEATAIISYSWPTTATGRLSGNFKSPSIRSTTGDRFRFGFIKTIGAFGLSADYGTRVTWEFITEGAVNYSYTVPFTVHFEFPKEVFPGQRVYLTPKFTWGYWNPREVRHPGSPSMQATQEYSNSHKTSVWFDAPDGLDETKTNFTQEANKARIYVKIPVLPLMDALEGTFDCTFSPCNEGGGEYGGSYTMLGGKGHLASNLNQTFEESDTTISLVGTGNKQSAWMQGHEQFDLVAEVLGLIPTPPTIAAGAAIMVIREIGGFRLDTQLDGDIRRTDVVRLELARQPFVDVPADVLQKGVWRFELPINFAYKAKFESYFYYPLGYSVYFDMRTIDRKELANEELLTVAGKYEKSNWIERSGEFTVKGVIPAVQNPRIPNMITEARPSLAVQRQLEPPPPVAAIRMARTQDMQRLVRRAETRTFPKPVAPRSGYYTVVVGRYPEPQARAVVADLAAKRVEAILLRVKRSTDKVVSCGSFAKESEAKFLSDLLEEMVGVSSVVTSSPYTYRPEAARMEAPTRIRR